ncbi:hypothetical protein scyTo_0000608 [Scyliorhinus torazame]|uniref:Uncharacterized protein n=1 Tax=Scyliorhinus torazame TaxID=75743 RepID=A0A401P057_SCYTO|nr:hypothetical protein [Scyliorhinus torazame]
MPDVRKQKIELLDKVNGERKAKKQLARELPRSGDISDSYMEEKARLERQIRRKAEIQHRISQECQPTINYLQEIEEEQGRELLTRQQVVMKETAGTVELQGKSNPYHNVDTESDGTGIRSGGTDVGPKLAHQFTESIIRGGVQNLEAEEMVQM